MKKFNVVFALSYEIEAEDENSAIDIAEQQFADEIENAHFGLTEMFGVNAEEIND